MKSAEEWVKEYIGTPEENGTSGTGNFDHLDNVPAYENWIKQIQLDAWKQGMSDAADLTGEFKYAYDAETKIRDIAKRRINVDGTEQI